MGISRIPPSLEPFYGEMLCFPPELGLRQEAISLFPFWIYVSVLERVPRKGLHGVERSVINRPRERKRERAREVLYIK
jgi:hypothetical protein